jgi:site-specific recombinase XerD
VAGLADVVTPHVIRHSFATDLVRTGTGTGTVAELLGHASQDSTRVYTLHTDDGLDGAIALFTVDRSARKISGLALFWPARHRVGTRR